MRVQVHCRAGFGRDHAPDPGHVRGPLETEGLRVNEISCRLDALTLLLEYVLAVWSQDKDAPNALAQCLRHAADVRLFRISPTRD